MDENTLTLILDRIKSVDDRLADLGDRLRKLESEMVSITSNISGYLANYSKLEERISEAHKRLDAIEDSPVFKANSVVKQFTKTLIAALCGACTLWVLSRLIPELFNK